MDLTERIDHFLLVSGGPSSLLSKRSAKGRAFIDILDWFNVEFSLPRADDTHERMRDRYQEYKNKLKALLKRISESKPLHVSVYHDGWLCKDGKMKECNFLGISISFFDE